MNKYILILLFLTPIGLSGQELKSIQGKNAIEKYKAELKKIEELKVAADIKYIKDLNEALLVAMKSNELEEANKIKLLIDSKGDTKEEKSSIDVPKEPKSKLTAKLSDKHRGLAGASNHNSTYSLVLRAVKRKKIILTIYNMKRSNLSMGEIKLNGEVIGSWELDEKSKEEFDLDITEHVKEEELKEYVVDFKYKGGGDGIVVTEIKATYK